MAKDFGTVVNHAVAKDKENNTNVAAGTGSAMKSSKKKQGAILTDKPPAVVPPPTNVAAPLSADKRKAAADANWDKVTNATKVAGMITKNQRATAAQKLFSRKLVSAMTWEIFSPPPLNSVSGKIVPRVLNRYKHRRLVSLEVHRVTPLMEEDNDGTRKRSSKSSHSYEECVLR
jgi:hypothetical protein